MILNFVNEIRCVDYFDTVYWYNEYWYCSQKSWLLHCVCKLEIFIHLLPLPIILLVIIVFCQSDSKCIRQTVNLLSSGFIFEYVEHFWNS